MTNTHDGVDEGCASTLSEWAGEDCIHERVEF